MTNTDTTPVKQTHLSYDEGGHLCYDKIVETHRWRYLADPLIRRGYRVTTRPIEIVYSLFELHNETINVWVHLVGGLCFLWLFLLWTISHGPLELKSAPPLYRQMTAFDHVDLAAASVSCQLPNPLLDHSTSQPSSLVCPIDTQPSIPGSSILSQILLEKMSAVHSISPLIDQLTAAYHAQQHHHHHSNPNPELSSANAEHAHPNVELPKLAQHAMDSLHNVKEWLHEYKSELKFGLGWVGCVDCVAALWNTKTQELNHAAQVLMDNARQASLRMQDLAVQPGKSLLAQHAEELASLSHMIEAAMDTFQTSLPRVENVPRWPLVVFITGAFICLMSSAIYHLCLGYNKVTFYTLCRVDLGGISTMICGSFFPPVYYTFYCHENALATYLTIQTLLCSLTLAFCFIPERFLHMPKFVLLRVGAYIAAGAFSVVPVLHIMYQWGIASEQMYVYLADGNLILIGILYLGGAALYTSRFPESMVPGKFDYFLSSHQLWHACVLAAALIHYYGCVNQYHWRRLNPVCPVE